MPRTSPWKALCHGAWLGSWLPWSPLWVANTLPGPDTMANVMLALDDVTRFPFPSCARYFKQLIMISFHNGRNIFYDVHRKHLGTETSQNSYEHRKRYCDHLVWVQLANRLRAQAPYQHSRPEHRHVLPVRKHGTTRACPWARRVDLQRDGGGVARREPRVYRNTSVVRIQSNQGQVARDEAVQLPPRRTCPSIVSHNLISVNDICNVLRCVHRGTHMGSETSQNRNEVAIGGLFWGKGGVPSALTAFTPCDFPLRKSSAKGWFVYPWMVGPRGNAVYAAFVVFALSQSSTMCACFAPPTGGRSSLVPGVFASHQERYQYAAALGKPATSNCPYWLITCGHPWLSLRTDKRMHRDVRAHTRKRVAMPNRRPFHQRMHTQSNRRR